MDNIEHEKSGVQISLLSLLVAGLLVQLLSGLSLWQHNSTGGEILGRFSLRYAAILGVHIVILLVWCGLVWQHRRVEALLQRTSTAVRMGFLVVGCIIVLVAWLTSVETVIKEYLSVTWLCAALVVIVTLEDKNFSQSRWPILLGICLLLLLVPMYVG